MDTRDTVVRVHGMSRCAKYQNRTRTRGTRDPITAGIPVPVTNPNTGQSMSGINDIYPCYMDWPMPSPIHVISVGPYL